jgi:hypothetical protein
VESEERRLRRLIYSAAAGSAHQLHAPLSKLTREIKLLRGLERKEYNVTISILFSVFIILLLA